MDFSKLVQLRRSVRSYSQEPVPRELLKQCVESARNAPSACNSQPWKFIIIDDKELLARLAPLTVLPPSKMNRFVAQAPALIAVVQEPQNLSSLFGSKVKDKPMELIDIGIAADHFCLQAAELGIGTCILGWFDEKKVKQLLAVPSRRRLPLLIAAGYPATELATGKEKSRKPLSEIMSSNGYNN